MKNPLHSIVAKQSQGHFCGVPSFCTANGLVIESIFEQAKQLDGIVLIESTANQVNQDGGYTYMRPSDFSAFVLDLAERCGFPEHRVILGGDHLGPVVWADESADKAMSKAVEMVSLYAEAGFEKIHLDTSMKLGSDPADTPLDDALIAERGAVLYKAFEAGFSRRKKKNPDAVPPAFVIGSEVPAPGGLSEQKNVLCATCPEDFKRTITAYQEVFSACGLEHAWDHIIGVVVEVGVEFGSNQIHMYDRSRASDLCRTLKQYPGLVFEGHSTDYQPVSNLRKMVEDGVAVLKVGPELTCALREVLFALSHIEKELIPKPACADFPGHLERAMIANPDNWKKHYRNNGAVARLERKYSLLDRCRYYLTAPEVVASMDELFCNLENKDVPLGLIRQYLPVQYSKVLDGLLPLSPKALVKDYVGTVINKYNTATALHGE